MSQLSNINISDLQLAIKTIEEAQRREVRNKNKDKITTMQQIRMHIKRLDTLYPYCNHDLLWKDRVCSVIGLSQEDLREQLYEYRVLHRSGKCSASFYESINFNPNYLDIGIRMIEEMNEENGICCTVYKQGSMTIQERECFNISKVVNMSNEECKQWYNDRIADVAIMYCCDINKAKQLFIEMLAHNCEPYNTRLYRDTFRTIGYEFNLVRDKDVVYNCEGISPNWGIPKKRIREYMVIVARDCLVI